ncbi:MAG: hypothetical protein AB1830_11265 [Pseudomonadota bacterium]
MNDEIRREAQTLHRGPPGPRSHARFPALSGLLQAAMDEARRRPRMRSGARFRYDGRHYRIVFTTFGRLIVTDLRGTPQVASDIFQA